MHLYEDYKECAITWKIDHHPDRPGSGRAAFCDRQKLPRTVPALCERILIDILAYAGGVTLGLLLDLFIFPRLVLRW